MRLKRYKEISKYSILMSETDDKKKYMRDYMKQYVAESETVKCPCGGKYKTYKKCYHQKTKRHMEYVAKTKRKEKDE